MYIDTSVLVKLFIREPDSDYFGNLVDGQSICSSVLAYTEVRSALLSKERAGGITKSWAIKAWAAFDRHVMDETIEMAPMGPAIFNRANRILEKCHPKVPLRSWDALHLATADQVQQWPLVTHDERMRKAAKILGFPISAPRPD